MGKRAWAVLIAVSLLSPLGLLAPGEAWGEWDISQWKAPSWWKSTAESLSNFWRAPLSDYNLPGWVSGFLPYLGYIVSAVIGVAVIYALTVLLGKALSKGK